MDKNYIKDLENFVKRMLIPMKDLSFRVIIKSISGYSVLPFKKDPQLTNLLKKVFRYASENINTKGIQAKRPNEVGNKIELFVKESLNKFNVKPEVPKNQNGKRVSAGYPDIIFEYHNHPIYLECKTYNLKNINTTQRSFYFSPSKNFKITKNAPHLMITFQIVKKHGRYFTTHWRLYSLENMKINLKHEFNQSNKKMYGDGSCLYLIVEEKV